ncbi:efflux RND transporter periplasmic adaptor subunit [Oculatella sp. LEGE 06141]|uniref:efflux RND transporter periplasmic adaptor subunit n=1 Tax=Oculatella sp. LEGE 06141 TaxID=1828648 RepID=UPI001882714C|nr:efflux RND transporter periplasmic adaptor subunit [Oculatella sp. LEGE 06141]MBE9177052.1 efflux RND transporter periplasmic adaptor subunit [Oculatella sp. LEGE 06141]
MQSTFSTPPANRRLSTAARQLLLVGLLITTTGCGWLPKQEAQAQSSGERGERDQSAAVETAIAQAGSIEETLEYTGTTEPVSQVVVRPQVEGQLLALNVDVGDRIQRGQTIARLDDGLLVAAVREAEAELAARRSEVAQAQAQVSDAQTLVEQARLQYQQATADARRLQSLAGEGAISIQEAETAQTAMQTAEQAVRSAQEQVRTRQQAIVAAQGRVNAQEAIVDEASRRRSYTQLSSPITGLVLERAAEPGNLIQPGDSLLQLGDFSSVKVIVQVSDRAVSSVQVGQSATVRLDAFANQAFDGRITRISPAANPVARLIPIEVTIPNPDGRIGSGMLARVSFESSNADRVVVPEAALNASEGETPSTLFVVEGEGENARAIARRVQVGERANGQVEILSGLEPGEAFIARSSDSLTDGQSVRLSILSETQTNEAANAVN